MHELKRDASGLLRRVEAGERIVVTVHGRAVADLVPHTGTRRTWRPLREVAALFPGVHDPDRDRDAALVDGAVTDPFTRGVIRDVRDLTGTEDLRELREP